jgi:hypothetical protein
MGCGQEAAELRAIDKELAKAKEILIKPPTQLQVAIRKLIEAANEVKKLTDENS